MKKKILKMIRPSYEYLKTKPWLAHIPFSLIEAYNTFVSNQYNRISLNNTVHYNCDNKPHQNPRYLEVITVAFNNAALIENQIDLLQKNLTDKFFFTVADNSNNLGISRLIENICLTEGVGYIRLPKNPWAQANLSHSVALNWLYYNYVRPRQAEYFGFLDHDVFPIKKTSVLEKFTSGKSMYGQMIEKKGLHSKLWYLWAGFCFFRFDAVRTKKINFSCTIVTYFRDLIELDTGGGNWKPLYSQADKPEVATADSHTINNLNYIDSWVHLEKASFKTNSEINNFLNTLANFKKNDNN